MPEKSQIPEEPVQITIDGPILQVQTFSIIFCITIIGNISTNYCSLVRAG